MSAHIELPSDPSKRHKLQLLIKDCVLVKQQIETIKSGLTETIKAAEEEFNVPKKIIRKLVDTAYKCDFERQQTEHENFEYVYESLMNGNDPAE